MVDIQEDEEGNVKIVVKVRQTVSHKVIKEVVKGGHVMAKACTLTVVCAVFIIVAWVVLDQSSLVQQ